MRRSTLLPLVLLVLAAGLSPAHAAQADAQVTIALPGGGERTVALAQLGEPDVEGVRYTLREEGGGTSELAVTGWSLARVLDAEELDGLTHLLVARADGTDALVLREQLVQEKDRPPVVWTDAQGTHLLRPSANEADVNADDLVTAAAGPLVVRVRRDPPFKVRIDASAVRTRPNRPIRLTARLVVGEQDPDLSFRWYLGDGSARVRGARVTHRFEQSGIYPVQVNLWKGEWELEAADVLYVRVAAPKPPKAEEDEPAATGRGGGAGGSGAGASGSAPTTPTAPPAPVLPADPAPQGELVSGTLLASADAAPASEGASGPRGRDEAAPAQEPLHVPIGVWIVAGLAVLVAAGWALESRHTAPFWQT